jgi:hypothetical protein
MWENRYILILGMIYEYDNILRIKNNKKMTNKFTFVLIFVLYFSTSFCQTLKYDIFLLGKKIGETVIEKKDSAGLIQYTVKSHSDAKILGMDKKDAMATEALFDKKGDMISSAYDDVKNKEHLTTMVTAKENNLIIDKNGKQASMASTVSFCSIQLYFSEPKDHQKIFSERLGQFVEIVKQKNGNYKIAFNDYTGVYTYIAGKLTELQMKETAGEVVMKLVQ